MAPKSERITSHCFDPLSPPFGEVALLPRFYTCFVNIHERVGRAGVEFHSWRLRSVLEVWILELDAVVDADGLISSSLLRSVWRTEPF